MSNLHPFAPRRPSHRPADRRLRLLPSLNFLLLLLLFTGSGALLWHDVMAGRFLVFAFVVAGWVVSLCLHEFGHALVAYLGGDRSVADSGYLDLDPMRYADPLLSIVLPLAYIILGGIGLPGGAIVTQPGRLRSRAWASAVAIAGPLSNLACLLALAGLYRLLMAADATVDLAAAVGVLALFQATAIILNLLPFPGLDGFGIIQPYLSPRAAARASEVGAAAFIVLFLLLWLTPAGSYLIRAGIGLTGGLGIDNAAVAIGFGQIKLF